MSNEIKVSVICNVYNHEKYVRDALEGFVTQKTDFAFEVLVHDDASTDGTAAIIREYAEKYPDLIKPYYQTENQYSKRTGIVGKIQKGRALGKYAALCEGDDYWTDPLKLQKQYDYMEAHPECSLCACSAQWLNMLTGKVENKARVSEDRDFTIEDILLQHTREFLTVATFVRSDIWKTLPVWHFPIGDYPLTLYAALNGPIHMMADTMCVYRWYSEGSWTAREDSDEKRIRVSDQNIAAMENFNAYTDYQYDELVQKRIRVHKYTKALLQADLAAIRSEELSEIYRGRDALHRLSDVMRCKHPKLHKKVFKLFLR